MKKLLFILILFTTLTPLVLFDKLPFPFVTEKTLYFRLLVDMLLCVWAVVAYQNTDYLPKQIPLNIAVLLLASITLLTAIFGYDFQYSFWSGMERMEGFMGLFYLLIYFFIIGNSLKNPQQWQTLFMFSCGVACVLVMWSIFKEFQAVKEGERLFSNLGNPTYLGLYLLLHLFLLGFIIIESSPKTKKFCYLMLPVLLIGLLMTQSRSTVLGLVMGVLILLIFTIKSSSKIRLFLGGFLLVAVVAGITLFSLRDDTKFLENHTTINRVITVLSSKTTGISRLNNWEMAFEGFKERPILGWGQENYQVVFAKYFKPEMYNDAPWYDRSHNFLLDALVSGGIIGILAFLLPFGLMGYFTLRSQTFTNTQKGLFMGVLVAYFTHNFFGFDSLTGMMAIWLILAYWQSQISDTKDKPLIPSLKITGLFTCTALAILSFYYGFYQPLNTGKQIVKIMQEQDLGQTIQQIKTEYPKAIGTGTSDFTEQISFLSEKVGKSQIPNDFKNAYFQATSDILKSEVEKHPNHPRLLSLKSSIDADKGDFNSAIKGFETVKSLAPNRHINLMQLAGIYTRNQATDNALKLYDEIYKINKYSEVFIYKAMIYSERNDTLKVWEELQSIDNQVFIQKIEMIRFIYGKHNNLQRFVNEFDRREKQTPTLPNQYTKQYYFEWAMAAFVTGNFNQSANQIFRYQFGNGMDINTARKNQKLVRNGKSPAEYFQ
jgi:O-antigen ligase/tetratricopeptide (TPR) repeat protein